MQGTAELDSLIGYHLRRATHVIMADLADRMATIGLRTTDASVLVVLNSEPLLCQNDIGRKLAIKRANMAPMIAELVSRGLIARIAAPGRAQPLRLTRKGQALAHKAVAAMIEHENQHFGSITSADSAMLIETLGGLWKGASSS